MIIWPDRQTYLDLSISTRVPYIPVWTEILADTETPISLYLRLANKPHSFLLESIEGGERLGRYSLIGYDPLITFIIRAGRAYITAGRKTDLLPEKPLTALRRLLTRLSLPFNNSSRFSGGLVGYLGYDLVREIENLPQHTVDDLQLPDAYLTLHRTFLIYDHLRRTVRVACLGQGGEEAARSYEEAVAVINSLVKNLERPARIKGDKDKGVVSGGSWQANMTRKEFIAKVQRAKDYIAAGDIFQVVLSQRLNSPFHGDPLAVYRRLRVLNPSPYMFYLNLPGVQLVGSSPEMLVRVEGDRIDYSPIAGTRPRGRTPKEEQHLMQELLNDEKERAEHLMLLDLGRNDVGKVAVPGSIQVPRQMVVEYYSHVMHLVSSITARLAPDKKALDALLACFPAGTVTGAPKVRAMEIIAELEPTARGPYAGAVGYLSLNGNLDTCIAIRTIIFTGGRAFVQAGAGIVADSEPAAEYEETLNKARAMLQVLDAGRGDDCAASD
ncbi:anthranilate synthase component I [Neomoorella humiferrea]|uniref:Anthranilate synthase component 1 n=1 Tax=Neomoorella humiferrea TaxID=676965 RepID=A0A2T0AVJ7_9FIRM|nr:anthranilate synthase component I [Moorella humiferrea]PRR74698.1 Anthranilate synthase component 1 [Moorella humiferrea]